MKCAILMMCLLLAACNPTTRPSGPDDSSLLKISAGAKLDEVSSVLSKSYRHQFTIARDHDTFICVSYAFGKPYVRLFFLFKNDKLVKIVKPVTFEYDLVPYN